MLKQEMRIKIDDCNIKCYQIKNDDKGTEINASRRPSILHLDCDQIVFWTALIDQLKTMSVCHELLPFSAKRVCGKCCHTSSFETGKKLFDEKSFMLARAGPVLGAEYVGPGEGLNTSPSYSAPGSTEVITCQTLPFQHFSTNRRITRDPQELQRLKIAHSIALLRLFRKGVFRFELR